MTCCARLNDQGLRANTTLLGEDVRSADETRAVADEFRRILDRIAERELRVNLALKLTHLGLEHRRGARLRERRRLVDHAESLGNFVRIDMEESRLVDATLRIYRRLRESGSRQRSAACSSRTCTAREDDLDALLALRAEPADRQGRVPRVAGDRVSARSADVDAPTCGCSSGRCSAGAYVAVATHDERLIEHAIALRRARTGSGATASSSRCSTACGRSCSSTSSGRGYNVLVATPYGPEWYPYLMRRLAERPANVLFFARNMLK